MTKCESTAPACQDGRSFPGERLTFLKELEDWHFWFDGRRRLVVRLLANAGLSPNEPVIDIGCGTGAMVATLRQLGYRAFGMDSLAASRWMASRPPAPILAADARALPLADGSIRAIVTLDVLEHTDDRSALREMHRVLKPGGTLILTVPALPWLWSHHDDRAGHLRRYTRDVLMRRVADAGFAVEEWHYYQCLLLPVLAAARAGRGLQRAQTNGPECPPRLLNHLFKGLTRAEVSLGRWIAWPIGSTLALRCRKRMR